MVHGRVEPYAHGAKTKVASSSHRGTWKSSPAGPGSAADPDDPWPAEARLDSCLKAGSG